MVIRSALRRQQFGATLVEFMISSILGIVVIGSVGSVFISGQTSHPREVKNYYYYNKFQELFNTLKKISSVRATMEGQVYL